MDTLPFYFSIQSITVITAVCGKFLSKGTSVSADETASSTLVNLRTGFNLAPAPVSLFIVMSGSEVNPEPPFTTVAPTIKPFWIFNSTCASPIVSSVATDPPLTVAVSPSEYSSIYAYKVRAICEYVCTCIFIHIHV